MATFQQWNDELVACPFNKAHRVSKSRLQLHIAKCQRDHPDVEKKTCCFNAQHRSDPAEYHHHLATCSDRAPVDRKDFSGENSTFRGMTSVPSYAPEFDMPKSSENWDDEIVGNGQGYDPQKNRVYFPDVAGLKPAERKKLYQTLHSNPEAIHYARTVIRENVEGGGDSKAEELVLKELRQPRGDHLGPIFQNMKDKEAEQHIQKVSLGRGESHRRIAANIFGNRPNPPSNESFAHLIRMGRGLGAVPTTSPRVGLTVRDDLPPLAHGQVEDVEVAVP